MRLCPGRLACSNTNSSSPEWKLGMAAVPAADGSSLHRVIEALLGFGIEGVARYAPYPQEAPAH